MSRHLEKILAHAERELTSAGAQRPTDVLPVYRKFLKIEEHRLRLRQRAGDGGREVCARRVDLIDILLRHVFAAASHVVNYHNGTSPITLVGVGGYGRRELNPCSDVDVMFLHREQGRNVSKATSQIVEQVLYLLWDIGFKVGHSTRTIKEAIAAANADMVTKTAMLESRLVTGDRELEQKFREQFRTKCVAGYEREYIEMRMRDQQERGLLRSEAWMKDVYAHSRNIFRVTERITGQFASGYSSAKTRSLFGFLPRAKPAAEHVNGFVIHDRQLDVERPDLFIKNPVEMMRAIEIAQERQLEPSPELADMLSRKIGLITHRLRYAKEPREIFRRILSRKGEVGRALRLMHRLDFLGQYIPEFGQLTCLVQHEFFHRYTADEHTLVCIDKLDALARTEDPKLIQYRKLLEELPNPFVLYLALLLHDTGKAVGARPHSEASAVFAQRVARRLQLDPRERKMLILLVDHHVTLSNIAQRRNIDDPVTVSEFAAIVKDQKNLDALMLLTLADGQGTSDQNWSDWKETLVWQLYHATSQYLVDRHSFYERAKTAREARETLVQAHLGPDYADEIEAHFDFMPDHYFRAFKVADMASHVALFRRFYDATCFGETPLAPVFR